jgi:hypothetical protein
LGSNIAYAMTSFTKISFLVNMFLLFAYIKVIVQSAGIVAAPSEYE